MLKTISACAAVAAMIAASPVLAQTASPSGNMKMTQAQCETLWNQALAGSSGDLAMEKAKPYVKDFKKSDTNADGKLSATEWMSACDKGWVQSTASTGTGTGAGGSMDKMDKSSTKPGSSY